MVSPDFGQRVRFCNAAFETIRSIVFNFAVESCCDFGVRIVKLEKRRNYATANK